MLNLLGMLGAIGAGLMTDKDIYLVGEKPIYTITGAIPGSVIAWTSFKDNVQTGEFNAQYGGQEVSSNGTAEIQGGPFLPTDVGRWQKQLLLIAPDGSQQLVTTFFLVRETAPAPAPPVSSPAPTGGVSDFLNGSFSIGGQEIPYWLVGVGVGLWFFTRKR